jgi:hypothetical protein
MGTPSTARSSGDQQWCDGRNSLAVARVGARRVRGCARVRKGRGKGLDHKFYRARMGAKGLWWGKWQAAGHQWPRPAALTTFKREGGLD